MGSTTLPAPLMGNSVLSMRRSFVRNGAEHFAAAENNLLSFKRTHCSRSQHHLKLMLELEGLEQRFTIFLTLRPLNTVTPPTIKLSHYYIMTVILLLL